MHLALSNPVEVHRFNQARLDKSIWQISCISQLPFLWILEASMGRGMAKKWHIYVVIYVVKLFSFCIKVIKNLMTCFEKCSIITILRQ